MTQQKTVQIRKSTKKELAEMEQDFQRMERPVMGWSEGRQSLRIKCNGKVFYCGLEHVLNLLELRTRVAYFNEFRERPNSNDVEKE